MGDLTMTIAERICNIRTDLGYSQDDLARKCGWSNRSSVSKIESSGDNISLKKISKIAYALGVSAEYLLGYTDNPDTIPSKPVVITVPNEIVYWNEKELVEKIESKLPELNLDNLERLSAFIEYQKVIKKQEKK